MMDNTGRCRNCLSNTVFEQDEYGQWLSVCCSDLVVDEGSLTEDVWN